MIGKARSKGGVPIRLTEERWYHIVEHHEDLAGYAAKVLEAIEEPDFIAAGWVDELLAVKELEDGFVITAYFTTKVDRIKRRGIRWSRQM